MTLYMTMLNKESELKFLRNVVGKKAYHILRCGGYLQIWRRTTPYNWWISSTRNPYEHEWHSEDGQPRPRLYMFDKVSDGPNMNVHVPFVVSTNDPEHSIYKLKKEYLP